MMKTRELKVTPDGLISGLCVVGYHGRLGVDQTPAKRAPVHADVENRLVDLGEARPAPAKKGGKGRTVSVKIMPRPIPEEVWTSTGTRIAPPWPARVDDVVVILGPREMRHAGALAATSVKDEPERVRAFLAWLVTEQPRSEQLHGERLGDLVAWCCAPEEAAALWQRLANLARNEVLHRAALFDAGELKKASFWLSRAATGDEDMYLAAAGLKRADYKHWKALLDAAVRSGTDEERLARVEAALLKLPRPAPAQPAPAKLTLQRRAINKSFELLEAA